MFINALSRIIDLSTVHLLLKHAIDKEEKLILTFFYSSGLPPRNQSSSIQCIGCQSPFGTKMLCEAILHRPVLISTPLAERGWKSHRLTACQTCTELVCSFQGRKRDQVLMMASRAENIQCWFNLRGRNDLKSRNSSASTALCVIVFYLLNCVFRWINEYRYLLRNNTRNQEMCTHIKSLSLKVLILNI